MDNFQTTRKRKEEFIKERRKFLRFFAILLLVVASVACVLFRIQEPFAYGGIACLYLLALAFSVRGMNRDYRLTPLCVRIEGNGMDIQYERSHLQIASDDIEYVEWFCVSQWRGSYNKNVFHGHAQGKELTRKRMSAPRMSKTPESWLRL